MGKVFALIVLVTSVCFVQENQEFDNLQMQKILRILSNKDVLGDIEPTSEQRSETRKILATRQAEMKKIGEMNRLKEVSGDLLVEMVKKVDEECFNKIFNEVLLPHQRDRILQLKCRQDLNSVSGSFSLYVSKKIDKELGVTETQKVKLSDIREEKLKLLREEARIFRDKINEIV